jgi:N,N-dimethylformamidase
VQDYSVTAGDVVDLRLSGEGPARLAITRFIHGDPNPAGPGAKQEPQSWFKPVDLDLSYRPLDLGSYVEVPHADALNPNSGFTLGMWVQPTLLTGGWQTLAAKWSGSERSYGLFTAGNGVLMGAVSTNGTQVDWCTGKQYLVPDVWQFVALVVNAAGEIMLFQHCDDSFTELENAHVPTMISTAPAKSGPAYASTAPFHLGAIPDSDGTHWAHFNGKLASVFLLGRAVTGEELDDLKTRRTAVDDPAVIATWDMSLELTTSKVVDVSPHELHGFARNHPARAVTGPRWWGTLATLCTDGPSSYDAIHFHDDDLDDPHWPTTSTIELPDHARPGIYGATITTDADSLTLPFIVSRSAPSADVCVIVPTFTWQAYSSNRGPYSYTEDGVVDRALCIYDHHSDGSVVYYSTRRKPTRSGNPHRGLRPWGSHNLPADLYLIDWLEHRGQEYDVLCDYQLDTPNREILDSYSCIVLGTHHEYWTGQMLDVLEAYIRGGGRVMYLSGNGLYWVTSTDAEEPWVMEVRKSGDGDFEPAAAERQPGQAQHSTSLERGGLWSRRGRPARRLVGVEHSANVFVQAEGRWGFERTDDSYDERYRFIFDGVAERTVGDFGLNLGTAAAYEMDSIHEWCWDEDWRPVLLARASHPAIMSTMRLPVERVADIALTAAPNGGAVFAAGAVTWTGSLSHNNYENNVSRITANVLEHFISVPRGTPIV